MITAILVYAVMIGLAIWRNYFIIEKKKQTPNYKLNVALRLLGGGLYFWYFSPQFVTGYLIIFMITFGHFWFDYGLNAARGKWRKLAWLGTKSFIDRLQRKMFPMTVWFWWKFLLMVAGVSLLIYYGQV